MNTITFLEIAEDRYNEIAGVLYPNVPNNAKGFFIPEPTALWTGALPYEGYFVVGNHYYEVTKNDNSSAVPDVSAVA